MKNIRHDSSKDELRAEYKRSDFGEMTRGKYARIEMEFAELVGLLITCIGEDLGLNFIHTGSKPGDWTYEVNEAQQITLRYWQNEFSSIAEQITNPPVVTTVDQRSELNNLLTQHVKALKARVARLSD